MESNIESKQHAILIYLFNHLHVYVIYTFALRQVHNHVSSNGIHLRTRCSHHDFVAEMVELLEWYPKFVGLNPT